MGSLLLNFYRTTMFLNIFFFALRANFNNSLYWLAAGFASYPVELASPYSTGHFASQAAKPKAH